ncbi:MAG TPA: hypothetical protein VGS11_10260 [Candidatus Bathyarchaeia archaeon]|nr:hypothetical protein [Candidatus Bathyarchaeia archaeon]
MSARNKTLVQVLLVIGTILIAMSTFVSYMLPTPTCPTTLYCTLDPSSTAAAGVAIIGSAFLILGIILEVVRRRETSD